MMSVERYPHLKSLFVIAVVLLFTHLNHAQDPTDPAILRQLHNIESSMDTSIDPCDDFYGYACGNYPTYMAKSEYPEMLTTVQGKFLKNIQRILKSQHPNEHNLKVHNQNYTEKLLVYLHTCQQEQGARLLDYLHVVKPGRGVEWPLLEEMQLYERTGGRTKRQSWPTVKYDIYELLGQLFAYGLNDVLFQQLLLQTDGIDKTAIFLPDLSELEANDVVDILSQTGLPVEITDKYYREILETHQEWQAIYQQYMDNIAYGEVPFDELRMKSPQLLKFLQATVLHRPLNGQDMFAFNQGEYFDYLFSLQWQPAEAEKFCTYLMVQFLLLLKDTVDPENCFSNANRRMHLAVNYVYHKHFYQRVAEQKNERLTDMIKKLYKYFLELVSENRLRFNDQQMQEIMTKLYHMTSNVGNLPENVTESMVEDFYRSMPDLDIREYYKNELAVRKQSVWEAMNCPPNMACDNSFAGSPVNLPNPNIVVFPFASLKPPMYHSKYDALLSLSLLGFITGHEFGHAIDPGSLNSETHFTTFNSNSSEHYGIQAAIECMKQQDPVTEFIDERVADAVAVQLVYRAYSREYGVQPSYTTIPWQQLFFLNMGQFFCGTNDVIFEGHDADNVRLRHIAMNSEEFSQAFQCPRGSNMNPARKCRYI